MRGLLVGILVVGIVTASAATAAATSQDAASTRAFIKSETSFVTAFVTRHASEEAVADALVNHISVSCPGALAADPQDGDRAQQHTYGGFQMEASAELALAEFAPLRTAAARSIREDERLRWSDPAIDRAIAGEVRRARVTLALKPPDLCAEAKASAATRFTKLPSASTRFLKVAAIAFGGNFSAVDLVRLMRGYAPKDVNVAIKRLTDLQDRADRLNSKFVSKVYPRMTLALFGTAGGASYQS
jgi:hypothetical protein